MTNPPRNPCGPGMTIHVYTVDRHGTVTSDHGTVFVPSEPPRTLFVRPAPCACPGCRAEPKNGAVGAQSPTLPALRAEAAWFLAQETLPRHQTVTLIGTELAAGLVRLIPQVEQDADPRDLAEARRSLDTPERPGLAGEVERVRGLARSVVALGECYGAVAGARGTRP
ncbi:MULTISPECIES: DUF6415 family natural product biosynthesis protein [unclassified Streptomyces]|uniref:DUF6415 family natural product biosynthesis protein n=1 Tax=unclassified Streptomyces TaxID=2593676 RepID=UPI0013A698F5|nr:MULTISPECIES: DUF6415 family natural product biosynthesis protein [unclassified Streptomyces]QZZ30299.1 hypothetical protein A7X85_32295 [Streptomyces sp. ST1015]